MHLKLHLTEDCNIRCKYCYIDHKPKTMSKETAFAAIDLALQSDQKYPGVAFFGGEPLLCKELIKEMVGYAKEKEPNRKLMFKLATNGLLLDEQFLSFAKENGIFIALIWRALKCLTVTNGVLSSISDNLVVKK